MEKKANPRENKILTYSAQISSGLSFVTTPLALSALIFPLWSHRGIFDFKNNTSPLFVS